MREGICMVNVCFWRCESEGLGDLEGRDGEWRCEYKGGEEVL